MTSETQKFYDFLSTHGHPLDSEIKINSSQFHRFKCPNGTCTDAAYKFFTNGVPAGYLHCWKCGISEVYCSRIKSSFTKKNGKSMLSELKQ